MSFSVRINSDVCEGHGLCILDNPAVFEADADGYGTVVAQEVPDASRAQVEACVRGCPAGAISIDG
ncbi:ferredoxin [Streptomyces sp. NPDC056723]|uniref:ferredoxin n=1 Tax=unclassified Streptomyces TaxID=2593676 RepID=UPI0036BC643D